MSTKSKLIKNNQTISNSNKKLMAIKNAFLRPLPQYSGNTASSTGIDTFDATASQNDIMLGKTAYVNNTKLIGTHVCAVDSISTQEKTATPTTITQEITPDSNYYLSKVIINPIPSNYIIPSGNKAITENGSNIDVANYSTVSVNVPTGITPTGSLDITANGTHDVTNYASVVVNVPTSSGSSGITTSEGVSLASAPSDLSTTLGKCIYWVVTKWTGLKNYYIYLSPVPFAYYNSELYPIQYNTGELVSYEFKVGSIPISDTTADWTMQSGTQSGYVSLSGNVVVASNHDIKKYNGGKTISKATLINYFTHNNI